MTHTTAALVRRVVERAVEGVLDRWAVGNTTKETELYIAKLRLTAAQLRQEADEIDELADQEDVGEDYLLGLARLTKVRTVISRR